MGNDGDRLSTYIKNKKMSCLELQRGQVSYEKITIVTNKNKKVGSCL